MSGLRPRDSCRKAFKDWGILPLHSQYIFSLLIFVVNNMGFYHSTSQILGFNTRHNFDLYRPQINLSERNQILEELVLTDSSKTTTQVHFCQKLCKKSISIPKP
jgi:hypothetical protein